MTIRIYTKKNKAACLAALNDLRAQGARAPVEPTLGMLDKHARAADFEVLRKLLRANNVPRAIEFVGNSSPTSVITPLFLLTIPALIVLALFSPYLREAIVDVEPLLEELNASEAARQVLGDHIHTTWGLGFMQMESTPGREDVSFLAPVAGSKRGGSLQYVKHTIGGSHTESLTLFVDDEPVRLERSRRGK